MITKSRNFGLWTGILLGVAGIMSARASSTLVTFSVDMATNIVAGTFIPGTDTISANGTYNGWGTGLNLVQAGRSTVYTNTANDTADANGETLNYKFVIDGNNYEKTTSGNNRCVLLPATSGASLVLPTPFFSDAGAAVTNEILFQVDIAQQVNLGTFIPGTSSVEVRGSFNGWAGSVTLLTNNTAITVSGEPGNPIWQGSYPVVGSPAAQEDFKYVIQPGTVWESPSSTNQDSGGNRYFANEAQTLPLVSFSDALFTLQFCTNTFSVDMSVVSAFDSNFDPSSLTLNGNFNGWGADIPMTNNPNAANANIYTSANIAYTAGQTVQYQFRYVEAGNGVKVYDHLDGITGGGGNRLFVEPLSITFTNVPPVLFNNAQSNDYILQPTLVLFSVNMASNGVPVTDTSGHQFNASEDSVYINGPFASDGGVLGTWYPWAGGINPAPAPAGFQMVEEGLTTIYTNTVLIPAGTPVEFPYLYGMDPGSINGGPLVDENTSGVNHMRVLRSSGFNPYVMPADTFGYQYQEPLFSSVNTAAAQLRVGAPVAGTIPVSWLGRPGAHLQGSSNLLGPWTDYPNTDGTNWTAGYSSTNGLVSVTNCPATGNSFFRVVKP